MTCNNVLYITIELVLSGVPFHKAIKYAELNKNVFEIEKRRRSIENEIISSNADWSEKEQLLQKTFTLGDEQHAIIEMMNDLL